MSKKVFVRFLKDRTILIVFFLLSLCSIIMFFYMSGQANTEIVYPFSIGFFLLSVYLLIDWFRYYHMNLAMTRLLQDIPMDLQPRTKEQEAFQQLLEKTTGVHIKKYNTLKEKNKERMYFLSHWLHHLKAPVSVIDLLIQNGRETGQTNETLHKIQHESKRLNSSIEQALTMMRMESFENDTEIISVDLISSLRKVINKRKEECIHHSIFPSIEFSGDQALVITDSKWNEILLDQIISNAIKYSSLKKGTKKLICRIQELGDFTTLTVQDEGIGMPSYDLERVFQPFFTGENGRKHENSTGVGLYLSKNIADKLGQTITIQSIESEGTTVTIRWFTETKLIGD